MRTRNLLIVLAAVGAMIQPLAGQGCDCPGEDCSLFFSPVPVG